MEKSSMTLRTFLERTVPRHLGCCVPLCTVREIMNASARNAGKSCSSRVSWLRYSRESSALTRYPLFFFSPVVGYGHFALRARFRRNKYAHSR
jgi:hypothetical protein